MYINKILMKFYHKSWFTHICRDFWKWQFHVFWGTFLNPQSLPGVHKGTFFMSEVRCKEAELHHEEAKVPHKGAHVCHAQKPH